MFALLRISACVALSIALALPATHTFAATSQPAPCRIVPPPAPADYKDWDSDDGYNLTSVTEGGAIRIRASGDVIRINATNFQSMSREIDQAIPNVSQVIFDARKIVIDAPLSFASGRLVFLADQIIFGPRGRLTLTSAPPASGDGLRLIANTITFDDSVSKPIQLAVSPNLARGVEAAVATVVWKGTKLNGPAAQDALWKHTTGSYFGAIPNDTSWKVYSGANAADRVKDIYRAEMFWPMYSSAKLDKFHSRDPYGKANTDSLKTIIGQLKPSLEAWSNPKPLMKVQQVEALIRLDLDSFGRSAAFAPRVDIQEQLTRAKDRLKEATDSAGYFNQLTNLVVAANERRPIDGAAVKEAVRRIDDANLAVVTIQADINTALARIDQIKQSVAALTVTVAQRQVTLASQTASDAQKAKDAANVKLGTNVLATGVAIGCMFIPGAQPVGIAIATGIQVTGGLIYANNTGGITTATVAEVVSKGADFYQKMSVVSDSWNKFKAQTATADKVFNGGTVLAGDPPPAGQVDARKALTKMDAAKQWGASAGEMASAVQTAYKSLDVAKPTTLSGTDREKNDLTLNDLLSQMGALNKEASDLAALITTKSDLLTITMGENYKAQEAKTELLAASVVNDEEIERWKANSLELWNQYLASTLRDVLNLRRSYFFETGALPNLPSDVLQYPEELLAFMRSDLYDPTNAAGSTTPPEVLRAHLNSERDKFLVSLRAIVYAIDKGIVDELSKRTVADVFRLTFSFRADSTNVIEKRFVQTINSQIAHQVTFKRKANELEPLYIPIQFPQSTSAFPERFVDAKITKIVFRKPSTELNQNGLTFQVTHPGYGSVFRKGVCYMFDLRDWNSENVIYKTTDFNSINTNWAKEPTTKIDISKSNSFYTFYPARSPLSLVTIISGSNWVNPPEIQEIDIGLEVMQ